MLDALYLGIKIFPADNRFWLMVISNLIDEKEYEVANKIIEEAATKLDD